ncbi:MAG: hypothetical protein ACKVQW_12040 [Pyrinomonadaceae bacterium]
MTELDQIWSQMLADAGDRAGEEGRRHVVEYLRLRATNDAIRSKGVAWLIDAFIDVATNAQRGTPNLSIERIEPHTFSYGNSTMVGIQLVISHGVRCLSIEAGWVRSPSHGIMRGGALAVANIAHFGMPKAGTRIRLIHHDDELPRWIDDEQDQIDAASIQQHLDIMLGS